MQLERSGLAAGISSTAQSLPNFFTTSWQKKIKRFKRLLPISCPGSAVRDHYGEIDLLIKFAAPFTLLAGHANCWHRQVLPRVVSLKCPWNQTAIVASQHVIHSQNIETRKPVRNKIVGTESTARSRSLQLSLPLFSMSSLLYLTSRNYITDAVWLAAVSYNLRLANNTPKKFKAHIHTYKYIYAYIYA